MVKKTFATKLKEKKVKDVTFKEGTSLEKIQSKMAELELRIEELEELKYNL